MSTPASSLPDRWVHNMWAEMRANYGVRWDRQFPVPPCPPGADAAQHAHAHITGIQAVWAKRLGHLQSNPNALRYALDHLPEHPITLPEFVALCSRRPDRPQQALPAPKPDPQRVQMALAGIDRRITPRDPLDWAKALRDADAKDGTFKGKRITIAQRETYQQALGLGKFARAHLAAGDDQ